MENRKRMENRALRSLLVAEFLLALIAVFTLWSQVGGQYHLDLMFWPWKLGIGLSASALIVSLTSALYRSGGEFSRGVILRCSLLLAVALAAGAVTYYYHLNEPQDEEDDDADIQQSTGLAPSLPLPDFRAAVIRPRA